MNRLVNIIGPTDAANLAAELDAIAAAHPPDSPQARAAVLALLKRTLTEGRERIRRQLEDDGRGRRCAERLAALQDTIVEALFAFASERVFRASNPSSAERLSLAAVGGYGRAALAPGSDIDLLLLFPYKATAWSESVTEYVLYMLWDLGLKVGHGTRTIAECVKMARADMTVRTALLEARYLCGDRALYDEFRNRFDSQVVAGTAPDFIAAKLAERDARHARVGATRYLVEPNVKDGKGGLRDLQTLFWIAKYWYRAPQGGEALIEAGLLSRQEYRLFRKCDDFLWAVRCHLHFLTGRPEERLWFDLQPEIARRLGYQRHPGLKAVERFMKHYFLVAKDVGDLTRIVCAALEERAAKTTPMLNRFLLGLTSRRRRLPGTTDFVVENHRINVADAEVFKRDPVNLIRIFHLAGRSNMAFHPDAMRLVTRSLKLIGRELRADREANRLFLEILTSGHQPELVLRRMNEAGVLGRFVPDFGRVVAMMQFNMYHHFTVDEHLLQAIGFLARLDAGELAEDHPLSHELLADLKDKTVLYVALFLHDIAKGRPEDHSAAGARVARRLCPRLGLTPHQTETVAWLVEHHLLMSMTAQSRDISDRRTVMHFAGILQTLERLKLLLVLTVCDIRAVGPGVWNGWKGQLLRSLYYETEPILTGGFSKITRPQRVAEAKEELAAELADWDSAGRRRILSLHYDAYWLRVDLAAQQRHAYLVRDADLAGRSFASQVRTMAFEGATEITVLTPDHPRLLSYLAGACAATGANIVHAQIYTTVDGRALDTIIVSRAFAEDEDEIRRGERIAQLIEQTLQGRVRLPDAIAGKRRRSSRREAFTIEPTVDLENELSDRYTVIEVTGLDRTGLLYDLTRAMSDLNLDIASAHIATFGERVVDSFYVIDLVGHKITNRQRQNRIRRRLLAVLGAEEEAPAGEAKAS
ncbi:MAG TPA: [protein-PII] uridylyltransferase [Afifellaceae bacterium]|nr:[protein-PII] uridylyltransferase [Afifellaceae bacterium]